MIGTTKPATGRDTMRAVGFSESLPIEAENSLLDIEIPKPEPTGRDLLVEIRAISVNPVDVKMRKRTKPAPGEYQILGWDAAGVVVGVGSNTQTFRLGDEVFYAGAIHRQGSNAEFHLVDERLVGPKPRSISFEEAAALPLTSVTAWESMFDRIGVETPVPGSNNAIVILGGAGGVGSIAIQLIRRLTDLTIVASASRAETRSWCMEMGAHHVIDHTKPLGEQLIQIGVNNPAFVFSTTHTHQYISDIADFIAPQGRVALIDDPENLDIMPLKRKSVSIHWESMFTRSLFDTPDVGAQHKILKRVSELVDEGQIKSTLTTSFGKICATNLKKAHTLIESGKSRGKIVLVGF